MSSRPNPKAFQYLAIGAVVAGGAVCYFQYSKLGSEQAQVAKLRTQVSDPKEVQKKLDDSALKLEGAKQSLAHLEVNVSSAAYIPSLLRDLDSFGKQNGLAVTGVKPIPKQPNASVDPKKPYDELSIQVTGNGNFDAIKGFVENLPKFPKIVAAHMVSIEPVHASGPDVPKGMLSMTVELRAYVFKSDGAAVAGMTPAGGSTGTGNGPAAATAAVTNGQAAKASGTSPATTPVASGVGTPPLSQSNATTHPISPVAKGGTK